jgi:cytoskeletal protein CcmA (bactofilin family)
MWNQDDARQDKFKPVQPIDTTAASKPKLGDASEPKMAQFGRSISVKGEITGSEDLTIDGQVDGRISLPNHTLTVGPNATICADIVAKTVMIFGTVLGSVTAHEKVEIRRSGSVEGNVIGARLVVQDGAILCGKVETRGERRSSRTNAPERTAQALAPVA